MIDDTSTVEHTANAPNLYPIPKSADRRLIDVGMLQYETSVAGFAERYRRGETPQTLHVWWARRPHRAMRALVFACLCRSNDSDAFQQLQNLSVEASVPPLLLNQVRSHLSNCFGSPPNVLDMFGGGGTIPFECASLGANTYALDSNELSVFIQQTILTHSHAVPNNQLVCLVEETGRRVLNRLTERTADLFPLRGKVFGYLWTYSIPCQTCGYRFYLAKRPWLSKKAGRRLALVIKDDKTQQRIMIKKVSDDYSIASVWSGRNGTVTCPKCNTDRRKISLHQTNDELVALVSLADTQGKTFSTVNENAVPSRQMLLKRRRLLLKAIQADLPSSQPPKWSGIVNPAIYGMNTHADVFNMRQQIVVLSLIQILQEEYIVLQRQESPVAAKAVITLLSGLIDQLVDWNCRLSMWIPQNEQVGRAFCGPGIAMLWDYCETDPVENGPANLWSKLSRIVSGTIALRQIASTANVTKGYAQNLPYPDCFFDAIVTDPPYYDNIFYNVLADFFFAWKRLLFAEIEPNLFSKLTTDSTRELVASSFRSGEPRKAHDDYCREFSAAIAEAERCLKRDGVFALLYSHGSIQGWEAIVKAYRASGLVITSVQPLSIERKQRPRAMTSDAINTCVVFVARRTNRKKHTESLSHLENRLETFGEVLGSNLRAAGWHDEDIGVAVFAQAVGMMANASEVLDCGSDIEVLQYLAKIVSNLFPGFKVVSRKSL